MMEMALCPTAPPHTACADIRSLLWSMAATGQFPMGYDFAIRNLAEGFPYSLPEFTSLTGSSTTFCLCEGFLAGKIPIEPFLGLNEHREIVLFPGFPLSGYHQYFCPSIQSPARHRLSP